MRFLVATASIILIGVLATVAPLACHSALGGQLQCSVSWIGNSFPGARKWVQQDIRTMLVTPDGTIYTNIEWDEAGREVGVYKDGDVLGMAGYPKPAELLRVKRLRYQPKEDVMYLGGTTAEHANQHWKPMGPVVCRYDRWSRDDRKLRWTIVAPYQKGSTGHESCEPMGFDVAGDYLFAPYTGASKSLGFRSGHIEVFRADDGRSVGFMEPPAEIGEIGLQDIRECLRVHRRADGEYLIFLEEDWKAKILMYRWKPSSPSSKTIFSPGSFWYTPIPDDAPLHPNSAALVAEFLRQKKAYYGTVGINTTAYASPVYRAEANTPTVEVKEWDSQHKGRSDARLAEQWQAVPIPDFAEQADGTDAEMTVYQPSTDSLWEFWQARKVDGRWQACWGGRMQNVSKSQGIWPHPYGTTATGLPFLGGQITAEELQNGEIRHALGIALVDAESWNVVSWPANRSDGYNPKHAPNRIPEGLRFRLDPAVDVDALKLHPIARTIAKAAQRYGFVVWDKAGGISLRAENPKSYTRLGKPDPYPALYAGTPGWAVLNGFPWDRLKFLPVDYGKP